MTIRVALSIVLAGFLALTGFVVVSYGYVGFFELAMANWATRLMFVDLTIALSLFIVWMYFDARERGTSWIPYALITAGFGAAGPLLYLIVRKAQPQPV